MAPSPLSAIIACTLCSLSVAKVYEIYDRDHYHDLMQDVPEGLRYASVIAFYNDTSECKTAKMALPFTETGLPSVEHLFLGQYEFSTAKERIWYQYDDHVDLPKNIGVQEYINSKQECECPILAFLPASYAEELRDDYLRNPSLDGVEIWDAEQEPDWKVWTWQKLEKTVRVIMDIPFDFEVTVNHQTINGYLTKINKPWTQTIRVDAVQSHTDITVFPGDTIYISESPEIPAMLDQERKKQQKAKKPTPSGMNPTYTVHSAMDKLRVIQFDDETWGFDDDPRREGISASFVARRHSTTMMTHTRNLVIPKILPATHPLGFIKMKMPPGLHDRLVRFYRKWYHLKKEESWDTAGTQLNYFHVKTHMISLDHDYRERDSIANDVMKPVLLKWAHDNGHTNISGLEFTAFYGIREYSRGASLRNHVDRIDTHVLSAVLQIAQTGVEDPWPLQVIGFDGKLVDVTLQPGEMILYEGHKLIHGRPYPFNGTLFANAFIHFKPVGWAWSTGQVWKSQVAKETLRAMHMDMRSIYH
eukprot:CAMPEP_0197055822 /NCGR_PEP_ID=MMETSP1384-20130603/74021_1 /TAXON_ID=29189 /ORGANISM="Ammonia sp." /LENGTH=529 /DNA_ID=CAMNT_0042489545 /DNA_START=21 /DNA_END=1610 /DNA_ORIENTATION=-